MYKAMSQEGERRLFHHLTEACEFAGKSYHSVYRAFKLGKPVDGIEEVDESEVHRVDRQVVFEEYVNAYWESEDCPFAMMEPDGSILFV